MCVILFTGRKKLDAAEHVNCIMFVYVKTAELLEKKLRGTKTDLSLSIYKLRSYRLTNNKIARKEKNNV